MAKNWSRQQSAIEYLTTYGWAILVIMVVFAALIQLGVFNSFFAPRAQAGSCTVLRPVGTSTITSISLQGVCNGELPQFVAQYATATSYIAVSGGGAIQVTPNTPLTFTFWINDNNAGQQQVILEKANEYAVCAAGTSTKLTDLHSHSAVISTSMTKNQWYFFAVTLSTPASGGSNTVTVYINGASQGSANIGNWAPTTGDTSSLYLGYNGVSACSSTTTFNGEMANVQMYNAALSAGAVQTLYLEGIGGAPIELQNLTAWWPLNGDTQDYGGNNKFGQPSRIIYTTQWSSGYATP
jgi:hypothetical protein